MRKALAEQRKAELDAANEEERKMRAHEEWEKEQRRQQIRQNMEIRLGQRIGSFKDKQTEQERKLEEMQRKKHED